MANFQLWLREETRVTERRTPLLPEGAKELIDAGIEVVVEKSNKRIFQNELYEASGCKMVEPNSWKKAPSSATILGLKELPEHPCILKNNHVYFAHAFKNQSGWQDLLARFKLGNSDLFDIEYMVNSSGRRVVAFGYFAGYMGAALALMQWYDKKAGRNPAIGEGDLRPFENAAELHSVIEKLKCKSETPTALVIGASGRSGKGAVELLEKHGVEVTKWGRSETKNIDRPAILKHDILVNCTFVDDDIPAFLREEDLSPDMKLKVISDVSCDPFSDFNPLPLYDAPTAWDNPYVTVGSGQASLDLIAIDNLPSLLPREASIEFSGLILPYLKTLNKRDKDPVWNASKAAFDEACKNMNTSLKQAS